MFHRRKKPRTSIPLHDDDEGCSEEIPEMNDTYNALLLLSQRYSSGQVVYIPLTIILKHQIKQMIPNATSVEQDLYRLRKEGHVLFFKIDALENEALGVVSTKEYQNMARDVLNLRNNDDSLNSSNSNSSNLYFQTFIDAIPSLGTHGDHIPISEIQKLFPSETNVTTPRKSSVAPIVPLSTSELIIKFLLRVGLLLPKRTGEVSQVHYQLSIPHIGRWISAVLRSRKEILRLFRRTQYQEMLLSDLEKKVLKSTTLSIDCQVSDMIGALLLTAISIPAGKMLRVRKTQL